MIKFTIILRRNPKLTQVEFIEYHQKNHAQLFTSLPEVKKYVRRYVQCHATGETLPEMPDSKIDGTTELWFDDMAGLEAVFGSESYLEKIRPDEEKFLDLQGCEFLISQENVVL